mmetsp:Transcript_7741/g.11669  ORF Transcript_7741/g.11669 Transcript_7741/m.11669 type:complete len:150 (+) Transcript_7741:71-520(+)|eukprot:CAMPEP_0171462646 /NCGR_PEP_ID=MMETSP0945-20130129/6597_1 /TAXON_ID=109269 /ORGANISM="Vaucheria litorea, Strain CCMP2940" /LENGTH=149 /DNA_ID=CAMNT_0011989207 /DNA_START=71 /DNA_END=520 /DNA_ORIENTATION=-
MFILKKNRILVYQYLFQEGVLVAKKDFYQPSHEEITGVPNLEVLALMKSLKSRELVRETFNWQHYYYYLTEAGIEYLREYLHLPEETIPATYKKPTARPARTGQLPGDQPPTKNFNKKMGVVGDFNPEYQKSANDGYRTTGYGRGGGGY